MLTEIDYFDSNCLGHNAYRTEEVAYRTERPVPNGLGQIHVPLDPKSECMCTQNCIATALDGLPEGSGVTTEPELLFEVTINISSWKVIQSSGKGNMMTTRRCKTTTKTHITTYKEMQNDHSEVQNNYKETQNNHKETQND